MKQYLKVIVPFLVLTLSLLYFFRYSQSSTPIKSVGGEKLNIELKNYEFYTQKDTRWANHKLGNTSEILWSAGCTLSCVSMSLDRLGIKLDPGKLNKKLTEVNGFTNRGWLIWSKIPEVTSDAVTITLSNSPTYHEIDDALKNGYSIITKIKLKERVTHWVLITGKNGSDYLVKDPLNQAKKLNKISDLSKQIYATRIIRN